MPEGRRGEPMLTDLDEALERLQLLEFEAGDDAVNLGPIAVVALEALGHSSLIPFFVDVYAPRLRPLEPGTPLPVDVREDALGDRARRADWLATFEAEIGTGGLGDVVDRWLPILLPGVFAAGGTGVLRTAAALRALEGGETDVRRRELAFGLAHWASRFRAPPDAEGVARGVAAGATGDADAPPAGETDPAPHAILDAVERLAGLQLARPELRGIHGRAIDVAMALHGLCAHVPSRLHGDLVSRALQCIEAIQRESGVEPGETEAGGDPAPDAERDALADNADELRYRAACSGDEQAIMLAEACLRAHAVRPRAVLMQAAADAALNFETTHGGRGG